MSAAARMRIAVEQAEGRGSLYFDAQGKPVRPGGRTFGRLVRQDSSLGRTDMTLGMAATYIVEYPFRPSRASLSDMVAEHLETGRVVIYNQERWDADPRIEEQAGACVTEDWHMEALLRGADERIAA